jgi:nicotinamidase/pyrazinamidase
MKKVVFWDVDTQYDFIMPDGKLCIPGAVDLLPNLARLAKTAQSRPDLIQIIADICDHEETDAEISSQPDFCETFPPHCMHGTVGQMKVSSTELQNPLTIPHEKLEPSELRQKLSTHRGEFLILKKTLDVFSNPNTESIVQWVDPSEIYLYGVALDFCDARAMEGLLRLRRPNLFLVRDAVEAIDRKRGEALVEGWRQRAVRVVSTDEVCRIFASGLRSLSS